MQARKHAQANADGTETGLVLRTRVFDAADLRRALTRIAHEIIEHNHGADDVVLVGLYTRGVALARRLAAAVASFESVEPALGDRGGCARSPPRARPSAFRAARRARRPCPPRAAAASGLRRQEPADAHHRG